MNKSNDFYLLNFVDLLDADEDELKGILNDVSSFKSNQNDDVEIFLKNNAVSFCRLKQSVTYLLYDKNDKLAAYFTLAFKILDLPIENMSKSLLKQVERFGQRNGDVLQLPCVLIAQWSKNYGDGDLIGGGVLTEHVWNILLQIQRLVGGGFVFLECEAEKERLVSHYVKMGFSIVNERLSSAGKPLIQFIKKI